MTEINPPDRKKRYKDITAMRKAVISDFDTPFNNIEMKFVQLALLHLQKQVSRMNNASPYKSMMSRYLQLVQTALDSDILKPQEDLYRKAGGIFRYEREVGPLEENTPLIRSLALLLGGHNRISFNDEYHVLLNSHKLDADIF